MGKLKLDLLQVSRLLVTLFCVLGFLYQVSRFTDEYFRYATESELSVNMPDEITPPDITICFRYVDVIDVPALSKERSVKIKSLEEAKKGDNYTHLIQNIMFHSYIRDVFNLTPSGQKVIAECDVKKTSDYEFYKFKSPEECNKHFIVFKFYLQEYICYRFRRILQLEKSAPSTFSYHSISYALDRSGNVSIIGKSVN